MSKLQGIKDLVQTSIDQGAKSVEEIHKAISNMPLNVLEKIDILESSVKMTKTIQETSIGSIYDMIRKINQEVGKIADAVLKHVDKEEEKENY
ncbi:MAG: hypothetical protein HQK79_15055 [Desulfobacterales bacterium]|nr:hypothetical protein [Desulfobacterales bacterium]MBF0395721.1 hypothetical protein [Desulfobacterales bacterium]